MKNKASLVIAASLALCFFTGCKSIEQPKNVEKPLDYTDSDVVENEKNTIYSLLENDCTRALFRAYLLGDAALLDECMDVVRQNAQKAVEEKNYTQALKLYKSLDSIPQKQTESHSLYEECLKSFYAEVPGYSVEEQKLPASIAQCIDATVTVWVDQGYKVQNGAGYADIVIGSGFFIDRRGYIITNHHVIAEVVNPKRKTTCKLYIKLPSDMEKKIPAKVVGYDSVMDLALLKVEMEPEYIFALGSSSDLEVGDKISVIGTPLGLEGTLTSGIISSTSRSLLTMGNVFQIDAAVNSGNSGGPLIDSNYKVQAVIFAGMLQYQGLNFAIPVEYLKQELPLLYSKEELVHGWFGAYGHTKRMRNENQGLEIQYVMPGSSASFAGLKIGDVITKVDGQEIKTLEALQLLCLKYESGTILNCSYERDGIEYRTVIYLDKRPEYPLKEIYKSDFIDDSFIPIFGIKMVRSSTTNKKLYKIEYVLEGSLADQNGFSENDSLELYDVSFDDINHIFSALIVIQRRKHGLLDIQMAIASSYDSPNYF